MVTKYDETHLRLLLSKLLGHEFVDLFVIALPESENIKLLVKATREIDWGSEHGTEGCPIWEYLRGLGYRYIDTIVSTGFKGGWLK